MSDININISTNSETVLKVEAILHDYGTDVPTALNIILNKLAFEKLTSNEIKRLINPITPKSPFKDLKRKFKGKTWMADDFNAPLDCLKEYMPEIPPRYANTNMVFWWH